MQISSRFTIAVHILMCVDHFGQDMRVTSRFLSGSINVNPVIVRNLLLKLRDAGLVKATRGTGGIEILKPLGDITMYDVYEAVESVSSQSLFHFHEHPNPDCPVGKNIHHLMDKRLEGYQRALEDAMRAQTLADLHEDLTDILKAQAEQPENTTDTLNVEGEPT